MHAVTTQRNIIMSAAATDKLYWTRHDTMKFNVRWKEVSVVEVFVLNNDNNF